MKKLLLCLAALMLLACLTACGRRAYFEALAESEREAQSLADQLREETNALELDTRPRETLAVAPDTQPVEPPETDESGETVEPETDSYGLPVLDNTVDPNDFYPNGEGYRMTAVLNLGGTGTYEGKSPEELTEIFRDAHGYGVVPAGDTQIITPTGIIFELNMGGGSYFYNKITGNITSMCADILCNHDHCIWASHPDVVYITQEHLYLTVNSDDAWSGLYRCDHDRNHMEKIEGVDITSDPRILYVTGDLMYLQNLTYISEEAAIQRFGVLNIKTGEFTFLSGEESIWVYAVTGDTVWYSDYWQSGPLYKADLAFTHTEVAFPEYEVSQVWDIGKESFNLYGAPADDEISPTPHASYNFVTDEVSVFSEKVKQAVDNSFAVDSRYVYYWKYVTDDEMALSPLRRFYQYKRWSQRLEDNPALLDRLPEKYWYYSRPVTGGRIWRMDLTTGEEEMVIELSFDGVPVSFFECVPDGNMLLVRFTTYKYYNNYYNQDFRFLGMITGTERTFYQWQHEPCLFGWKKSGKHQWYSDRKQTTIWEFDKPKKNADHPTMKPVPLLCYPITNSSMSNTLVLDPFGGSGSTLIACEQTDRSCCTIELDEKFCDVIVRRYIEQVGGSDGVSLLRDGMTYTFEEVPNATE